jgi:hypothetical protein
MEAGHVMAAGGSRLVPSGQHLGVPSGQHLGVPWGQAPGPTTPGTGLVPESELGPGQPVGPGERVSHAARGARPRPQGPAVRRDPRPAT